ncbi:MAG: tRNA (guanosine(46)-N7)-methyltransferase TrmB [Gammaproteobacteria bacterium]
MAGEHPTHPPIRSFVRRAGRLTAAQKRALDQLWPRYGIDYSPAELDLDDMFGRHAPRTLEIGFGNGELLATMAAAQPDTDFIGVEVHGPGVGHCLLRIERDALTNVRLIRHDAVEVLRDQIADAALSQVNLFFADPWPKKRHHKRRIVQPEFMALLGRKLAPGGLFHVATDWMNYAEHIEETANADPLFEPLSRDHAMRPETRFELRGKRLGHEIWERSYRRK